MNRTDQRVHGFLLAVPALGLAVLAVRRGGGFTGWDSLTHAGVALAATGAAVLVLAVLARVLARVGGSPVRGRAGAAHVHAGPRADIARHEAGHAVAARALGGRVISATVDPRGRGGLVRAHFPHGDTRTVVAFLLAGQLATGHSRGADADNAAIRAELRGLPAAERRHIRRDATRDARRALSRHAGQVRRDTATLIEKGHL